MKEHTPITMKDIARELRVSIATVSRALNDSPRISKDLRERIKNYAETHHFTPNHIAKTLRSPQVNQRKIIGVIVPQFTHFYFSSILSGIEQKASAHGYQLMIAQSNEEYEREVNICKTFYEHKVCGIIVSQAKSTHKYDHFKLLINLGVPLVFYDRICTGVNTSRVVVDDYIGAFNAVTHLINTGCSRIAYFGIPMTLEISKNRYKGYYDALLKNGIRPREEWIRLCDNRKDAATITTDILSQDEIPDAFFAVNDDTAIGVLNTVKRMGYRVPEDISICGFTNEPSAISCDPMLTTVEQLGFNVGEEAANIIISQLEGTIPKDRIEKRIVRTRLIIRETTR